MTNYLIIPGLGNSGPEHWQTYFEHTADNFMRINQEEWDAPSCKEWVENIDKSITLFDPSTVVLIGHSLGCATIAHWAKQSVKKVKGAILVAPSDIENPVYTFPATGFAPIPIHEINFPTIVVASTNDPWVSLARATFFAQNWGSRLINIGEAGHINSESGFGKWDEGLQLLKAFD